MSRRALRIEHLWLLVGAVFLLALLFAVVARAVEMHRWASSALANIEPRYSRLLGLQAAERQMRAIDGQIKTSLDQFAYPASGDPAQIGNAALQRVRDIATKHGMRVASSQVLPPKEDGGFDRIGLPLSIEGDWPQLYAVMRDLAAQKPTIFSESIQIGAQPAFKPSRPPTSVARLNLFILKARS